VRLTASAEVRFGTGTSGSGVALGPMSSHYPLLVDPTTFVTRVLVGDLFLRGAGVANRPRPSHVALGSMSTSGRGF